MVQNTINKLKFIKPCGSDGLSAERFMHSDRCITALLSIFYNRVISHGHLSNDFMKTIIIPLVKISCSILYLLYKYCVVSFMKVKDLPFACSASTVIRLRSSLSVFFSSETETLQAWQWHSRTPHMGYL